MLGDLPPSSSVTRLSVSAALLTMILPTAALPVNAILSTPGCATSAAPAVSPKPLMMLTTPGRQANFVEIVGEFERGERRLLGGLQHAAAARGRRGRELPRGHQQRIVPRNDLCGDTDRLAQREAERVGGHRIHVAGNFGGEAAVVLEAGRDVGDVVFGFDDRLAGVAAFEFGKRGGVLADFFGELEEDAAAVLRGGLAPRTVVERFARGFHGASTSDLPAAATWAMTSSVEGS